jgi:nucleotide-binding universal stress UspA family protein
MQATNTLHQVGMNHPILVPVDFSDCSRAALIYAARMTADIRAPLLLLHVIHDHGNEPGFYRRQHGDNPLLPITDIASGMFEDWLYKVRRQAPELDKTLRRARMRLVSGLPGRRIVEVAEAEHAVMIVMGTHGRMGLSQLLRSSITEYVMAHATVPVTTLREGIEIATGNEHLKNGDIPVFQRSSMSHSLSED